MSSFDIVKCRPACMYDIKSIVETNWLMRSMIATESFLYGEYRLILGVKVGSHVDCHVNDAMLSSLNVETYLNVDSRSI